MVNKIFLKQRYILASCNVFSTKLDYLLVPSTSPVEQRLQAVEDRPVVGSRSL